MIRRDSDLNRLRQALDDFGQLFGSQPLMTGKGHQLACSIDHCRPLGSTRDGDPSPSAEVEDTFVPQEAQRSQHRVRVDAENRRQVLGRGIRCPGDASPSAMARRISAATWSWRAIRSERSILTREMMLSIIAL